MYLKTFISLSILILTSGFYQSAVAAPMNHDHGAHVPKIKITPLNIKDSGQSNANSRHYCPMHGHMMDGPFCNIGRNLINDLDSSSNEKKCFLSTDCGGAPYKSSLAIYQADNKITTSAVLNNNLKAPSFAFFYTANTDSPTEYFQSPEKPPKEIS